MSRQARTSAVKPARYDGVEHRRVVLEAALQVFSDVGFAAASTRAIAAQAGIEQGHLAYYFPTKLALWQQVVEAFARSGEAYLQEHLVGDFEPDASIIARRVLPGFLRTFAQEPRLTRLMLQDFSISSDRHAWLVETAGRPVWALLQPLFKALARQGRLGGASPEIAYFSLIGSALITFGNEGLVRAMTGVEPGEAQWIDAAIAHMIAPVLMTAPAN